ncbi:MAG: LemA family protein [Labilithrix sp.]|nr:LemA family protein [Labilithrix sp.]
MHRVLILLTVSRDMTEKVLSALRELRAGSFLNMLELVLLVFAGIFAVPGCQKYDQLIEKDQVCQQKWSDLDADLQRRSELVPNLVATVKASANYEQSTLTKITEARASATSIKLSGDDFSDPAKMKAFEDAQAKLSAGAIGRLLVSNENYPKLQANGQFTDLMKQLEGTENRILRARQQYNESVKDYNSELGKIRGAAVNKATGQPFKPRVYFAAAPESTAAPKVSF